MQPTVPVNWPVAPPDGRSQLLRENFFTADHAFEALLRDRLGEAHFEWLLPRLRSLGQACADRLDIWAAICDRQTPVLTQYDHLGQRVDRLDFPHEYHLMEQVAYGDAALVSMKYNGAVKQKHGDVIHTMGFALGYLFAQADAGLYCPVCMTDGVARLLEKHAAPDVRMRFLPKLTTRDVGALWQGAMYLTEKQGGSDVGANVCRAVPDGEGTWRLFGEKWFCSNLGGRAILALARPDGAPAGTKGLGLFLVPQDLDGKRNGIVMLRAKDKMGVRSMPTGEVVFDGARAWPVGDVAQGFKLMAEMLNLSRLYNAVASVGIARRALAEARVWLEGRQAFGRPLMQAPLVREQLADYLSDHLAALYFTFETVSTFDAWDARLGDPEPFRLVRIRTPLTKRWTGALSVGLCSAAIELIGGHGYINDFVTPRLLRDAQVLPLWEGAANILALDLLRAIAKENALEPFLVHLGARLAKAPAGRLSAIAAQAAALVKAIPEALGRIQQHGPLEGQALAGRFADRLTKLDALSLLLAAAATGSDKARTEAAAVRFWQNHLAAPDATGLPKEPVTEGDLQALLA